MDSKLLRIAALIVTLFVGTVFLLMLLINGYFTPEKETTVVVQETVSEEDYEYKIITKDNYVVGSLHSIPGKHGYYNLLNKAGHYKVEEAGCPPVWDIPEELITVTSISIGGTEYPLEDGFFFITKEPVRYFMIGESFYEIE